MRPIKRSCRPRQHIAAQVPIDLLRARQAWIHAQSANAKDSGDGKDSSYTSKLSVPHLICAYAPYRRASANRFAACAQVRIDLLHARPSTLYCTHVPESRHRRGVIDIDELHDIEKHATSCPCTCGWMFTSNTMATFHEAVSMSLPGSALSLR